MLPPPIPRTPAINVGSFTYRICPPTLLNLRLCQYLRIPSSLGKTLTSCWTQRVRFRPSGHNGPWWTWFLATPLRWLTFASSLSCALPLSVLQLSFPPQQAGSFRFAGPCFSFHIALEVPFSGLGVMSLAAQGRRMFVLPVGGLGILGRGALGHPGTQGGVFTAFPLPASFVINTGPPSELLFIFREGLSSRCGSSRLAVQRCYRISVLGAWLLQPLICNTEGHGWLAASHQSFLPQPLRPTASISHGDGSVCPPISSPGGLDGLTRPSGCLPPGPCPSGLEEISLILYWPSHLPVSGPLLWTVVCSTGIYSCHGPDLLDHASSRLQDSALFGRLARLGILSRGDCVGEGLFAITLRPTRGIS